MDLHKVVLATESKRSLERVRSVLGNKAFASLTAKTTKKVNELAYKALDAYRSKIPIEKLPGGGALRNSNLQITPATPQSGVATVSIEGTHVSVRSRKVQDASALAQDLDNGVARTGKDYKRSRISDAVSPYSAVSKGAQTKGWIRSARQAFAQVRRKG